MNGDPADAPDEIEQIRQRLNKLEGRENYGRKLRKQVEENQNSIRGHDKILSDLLDQLEEIDQKYSRILEELDKREAGEAEA